MYNIVKEQTGTEFQNVTGKASAEIDGNSYQATRSGKNLLKETSTNGGDNNYWSSYSTYDQTTRTLTRTTSKTTESYIEHRINGLKSNTTYTLSLEVKSNGYVTSMDLYCFNSKTQGIKSKGGINPTTNFQKITWTFTTASDVDYSTNADIRLDNNGSTTSGTDATLTVRNVMLVEGTDTDYEEYGVMPSLDYPSDIEVIYTHDTANIGNLEDGHIGLRQTGKNIAEDFGFDVFPSEKGWLTTVGNSHYASSASNGILTLQVNANSFGSRIFYLLNNEDLFNKGIKSGQTYTYSVEVQGTATGSPFCDFEIIYNQTTRTISGWYQTGAVRTRYNYYEELQEDKWTKIYVTVTLPNNDTETALYVYFGNYGGTVKFRNFQIEKGSTATDYEEYKETIYDIDLNGNTLCKVGNTEDLLNIDMYGNVNIQKSTTILPFTDGYWLQLSEDKYLFSSDFPYIKKEDISIPIVISDIAQSTESQEVTDGYTIYSQEPKGNIVIAHKGLSDEYTLDDFKKMVENHYMYVGLLTPETITLPSITPIELYEGVNNFELLTNLDTDYSITTYYEPVTDEFKTKLLNGKTTRAYMKFPATETQEELIIDENNYLKDLTFSEERYVPDEGFIGQAVAKEVTGNFYNVDTDFNIQDREFELYLGVDLDDGTSEYINYGTYIVQKPENDTVEDNTTFTALDYMVKFNQEYTDEITYPCTARELLADVCSQAGVEMYVPSFLNEDFEIENNQFETGTTLREVLKAIAQIAFNWARIDEDNMLVMDFDKSAEIKEELDTNDFFELNTQDQYGEINNIILRYSQVEGENASFPNEESISLNGEVDFTIEDNPFAYTSDKMFELGEAGEELWGLKYIPLTVKTIGYIYLNCKDKIKVTDLANKEYETYILNHTFTYNGVISEDIIETKAQTEMETKYQFTSKERSTIKRTEFQVDKNAQEISGIVETLSDYEEFKITVEGVQNTLKSGGGNNILYYSTEYWQESTEGQGINIEQITNSEIKQNTVSGFGYIVNNGACYQLSKDLINGYYVLSFKYKKLTDNLSNISVKINEVEYTLDQTDWTEFSQKIELTTNNIKLEIISDTNSSLYICDILLEKGENNTTWTQNPNETMTDNVTIGKGIKVQNSNVDTYTTIDADGTRIWNNRNNQVVAEFTYEGIETKNINSDSGNIANLLIKEVNDQTWFIKL